MLRTVFTVLGVCLISALFSQTTSLKKQPTLVFQGGLLDFETANKIRSSSSIASIIGDKQWSKMSQMEFGLGASFINGISDYLDYSANLYVVSGTYPVRNETGPFRNNIIMEADASVHLKLLPDSYVFSPYLSGGLGIAKFGKRFEAFMPVGAGLQVALPQKNFIFSNIQYRLPVTSGANYHFLYSFGFGRSLGD